MKIALSIIKWLCLIPLDMGFGLLAKLLNSIVVLFANDLGYLPWWLYWFGTPDNPLDGDAGWISNHLWWKGNPSKLVRYINRWRWLNRNTAMGFSKSVMGAGALEDLVVTKNRLQPGFHFKFQPFHGMGGSCLTQSLKA